MCSAKHKMVYNTATIHLYMSQATIQITASTDETFFAVTIENVDSASQMWIILGRLKQKTYIIRHTHTLHTDPAHHALSSTSRNGCIHGQLMHFQISCLEYTQLKLLPFLLQPVSHDTPSGKLQRSPCGPLVVIAVESGDSIFHVS